MMPLCSRYCLQMALTTAVYIMCVFSTGSTKKCGLQMTEKMKDTSATLRHIDIKFYQLNCQDSFIFASCRKSKNNETGGFSVRPQNHPHVLTKPSASKVCNRTPACLESESGKAISVQATPSPAGCHDLYVACRDGKMTDVKRILSTGNVSINCRFGRYSKTPVMWAAYGGHRDVLEFLVKKSADVSMVGSGGSNLLFWACLGGHVETVKFILSLNVVDINARTKGGWTEVGWARRQGHQRVVDLMVSRGAQ